MIKHGLTIGRTAPTWRVVLRLATVTVLALTILGIAFLWADLRRKQDALVDARSDNVQWTIGQAMVEYQDLKFALYRFETDGPTPERLAELRQRFDIFYNRMDILMRGGAYRHLLDDSVYAEAFLGVRNTLEMALPAIDGTDAELAAALPELIPRLVALEAGVRDFVQDGVRVFAENSTALRRGLSQTMDHVAWLSAAMLAVLLGLTAVLFRESRLAEERLVAQQRSAARLKTILGTSSDAIVVTTTAGRIVRFNVTAQGMFGLTTAQAHGRVLRSLMVPDTEDWHPDRLAGSGIVEMAARDSHGRRFPVELKVEPIETDEGPLLVAFIRDITTRKGTETELIGARDRALAGERAKADFVAVMSHELRTPLDGILGMLALLRNTPLNARQRDYIEKMETSGRILLASVDDVLEISRTEAGRIALSPAPTALEPLLRSVAESQSGAAAARGNRIRFVALTDLPDHVVIDAGRLRQILVNLIGNAVKFTENGEVALEAESLRSAEGKLMLLLRVTDTGIGIAAENLTRIFDDFETLDPSLSRRQSGAGLGLAIVRRLVEAMDGEIDVESEPGAGSIFTVTLPLLPVAAPAQPVAVANAGDARSHRCRVLVVEDNDVNRAVLSGLLDRRGCMVVEAGSGPGGIARAEAGEFDLILMDLSMPGLDGVEAARRIGAGGGPSAATPIYLVTAHAAPAMRDVDARSPVQGVLTKPILPAQIDAILNRCRHDAPPEPAADAGLPELDTTHLGILLTDLGPQRLVNLLERFSAEAARETRALAEDAPRADFADLIRRAHRLAGAAQNLGARRLARRLATLQEAADAEKRPVVLATAAQLPGDWALAEAGIDSWRTDILADQTP